MGGGQDKGGYGITFDNSEIILVKVSPFVLLWNDTGEIYFPRFFLKLEVK